MGADVIVSLQGDVYLLMMAAGHAVLKGCSEVESHPAAHVQHSVYAA